MTRARAIPTGTVLLALVSYLPALASSPGRMPADTKLYLYLDPGGLIGRAASTFEPDQFAGWVPHQQITYLWPSGPWFWLFDALGVPDWIAHRLWIGTILFAAGSGVMFAARRLLLAPAGAVAAGFVYCLSPFLLAYVSRTSLLLLPWAALGWIVGLTVIATDRHGATAPCDVAPWRARLIPWREPALIALIVATVGSANATALAMVIPAPLLWLVHVVWRRVVPLVTAIAIAVRVGLMCVMTSLWWVATLVVQSRHGADVLAFSETLEDVSRNSTGSEVLRGLGYWLFYQRDVFGPTTTASYPYLVNARAIAVSFTVVLIGLAGIAISRWPGRGFAAWCVAAGGILAVGVHPYGRSSPLMELLAGDDSGLALALRSSTRAVPVLLVGVALGAGALVAAAGDYAFVRGRSIRGIQAMTAALIVAVSIVNLPALAQRALVDPVISRDAQPPSTWVEAAALIDERSDGGRVLQLPGAEFGAFDWGYTADQPLVALAETPLITRDLLPLGSAPAMDLLYALDDRFQEGWAEPQAIAPIARLLGATTVLLTNDMQVERYRTARPELVDALVTAAPGIDDVSRIGDPRPIVSTLPMIDPAALGDIRIGEPINPLTVASVEAAPGVLRAKTTTVVVSGSGDGLVDAAAAGLIDGHELIRYSASLDGDALTTALTEADLAIVTDSNRDRAHHWRGSQDVHGHTEPGGAEPDVLEATASDQRLDVFGHDRPDTQTVAEQVGPVQAIASSYGEPYAYRPESRAVMAIDGDPTTAWSVGDHGDPVGERIRLTSEQPMPGPLVVNQFISAPAGRRITEVAVRVDDGERRHFALSGTSSGDGEMIADDRIAGASTVEIEIVAVSDGDPTRSAGRAGVGFSEISVGVEPTTETIRVPADATDRLDASRPLAIVLTRWRVDPSNQWRSDPEPTLRRSFEIPQARSMNATFTLRLDRRASDDVIADLLGAPATIARADRRLTGSVAARGAAAVDGDPDTAWITPFDAVVGARVRFWTDTAVDDLTLMQASGDYSTVTAVTIGDQTVDVPPPDASGASRIALDHAVGPGEVSLTVAAIEPATTIDRRYGDTMILPVAIAEIRADGVIETPPLDDVVIEHDCDDRSLVSLDGVPVAMRWRSTAGALLAGEPVEAEACDAELVVTAGRHDVDTERDAGLTVDRITLSDATSRPSVTEASVTVLTASTRRRSVVVDGCTAGCWLVLGEGYNTAWRAAADGGGDLGAPSLVDGSSNGWWLEPSAAPRTVTLTWTAQTPVTLALWLSTTFAVLAIVLVAAAPRAPRAVLRHPATRTAHRATGAIVFAAAAAALIGPVWALGALGVWLAATRVRPDRHRWWSGRIVELVGLAMAAVVAVRVIVLERQHAPWPNAGWTVTFEHLNAMALFAMICLAVGATGFLGAPETPDE